MGHVNGKGSQERPRRVSRKTLEGTWQTTFLRDYCPNCKKMVKITRDLHCCKCGENLKEEE